MSKKKSKPDEKKDEKNLLSRFTEIVNTRWKFLLYGYFLGYGISLFMNEVPNIYYVIPIKVTAVGFGWAIGNAFYLGLNNPGCQRGYYAIIHTLIAVFLMGIAFLLVKGVCWILNIDPTPFYG